MMTLIDPYTIIDIFNTVLCIVILIIGYWGFHSSKNLMLFVIGIAFGLFGVTHIFSLLHLASTLQIPMLIIRIFAYLLVLFAINRLVFISHE